MYKEWAQAHNDRIKNILNSARADHTQAVKDRIENVQQMGGVVDITKSLFAVSKVYIVFYGFMGIRIKYVSSVVLGVDARC